MMETFVIRSLKILSVCLLAFSFAGCTKDGAQEGDGLGGGGLGAGGRLAAGSGIAGAATPGSTQDFSVNVGDRVFFDTDSTELTTKAQDTLNKQARWLSQYPRYHFVIEGHADERGTRDYNFALAMQRANAVRDYLAAQGVSASRMQTASYGKERPVAVCNDISCWSQNRRAVTNLNGG